MQGVWMLDRGVGAACGSDKVGSSCSRPRRGAGVVVWWGAGFTEESVGRRPPCYRRLKIDLRIIIYLSISNTTYLHVNFDPCHTSFFSANPEKLQLLPHDDPKFG